MKTEQLMALDDNDNKTKIIHKFTDKTLVNGHKDKSKHPDLAPKLHQKLILIPDMAEILQLQPSMKNQVWGQLRNLFDGFAGTQSGMGTDIQYKGIRVTLIGASTPAIDDQILIHQSLGTRELFYRPKKIVDVTTLMEMVWKNEEIERLMRENIKTVCQNFIKNREIMPNDIISTDIKIQIEKMAAWLCDMRASASVDSYSGELRGDVHPEKPTRVLKQLKRIYICLKSLDDNYPDQKALKILKEIVESSADQIRLNILDLFKKTKTSENILTTSQVADKLRIGKKTAKTELSILWNLGLLNRNIEEALNSRGEIYVAREEWSLNYSNLENIEIPISLSI